MSDKKEVVIKDACILFDLIDLGLLPDFYCLPLVVVTTPQVLAEIVDEAQIGEVNVYVVSGQLQVDDFSPFETLVSLLHTHKRLSLADVSVLEVATRREAAILSNDKSLRNESTREGLIVHGTLWILEELYINGIIDLRVLVEKLEAYSTINKRAPQPEIEKLLKKFKI